MPKLINSEMWHTDRQQYTAFCARFDSRMPLFFHPWWLDAVCGNSGWRPVICPEKNMIWPAFIKRKWGIKYATQPPFTPLLGCWSPELPVDADEIQRWLQHCGPLPYLIQHQAGNEVDNQAFAKANFTVIPYKQYAITPQQTKEQLFRQFNENARRNIKKASQHLIVFEETDAAVLHHLITLSYQRHQIPFTTSLPAVQQIFQVLFERQQGIIWTAKDAEGRIHASILLGWDHQTLYYLAGGLDHRISQVGASRWLLWKAICKALEMGLTFNFGGGLTPSIDAIYQSMHGQPVPWVRMSYTSNPLIAKGIRLIKKVLHRNEAL